MATQFSNSFASVMDNLLEGCQIIDSDWRYVYVNEAVVTQARVAREALLGHTMMEIYPRIDKTEMFRVLRRCMRDGTPSNLENEFTFPDGSVGWFELRFNPVAGGY